MVYQSEEEIVELVKAFESAVLPKTEWTHAAHLSVALWYCRHNGFYKALEKMRLGIQLLNSAHGVPTTPTGGYHETLTIFWMQLVWNFLQENSGNDYSLLILTNKLVTTFCESELPLKFYSRERLFSVGARTNFIEPDLIPIFFSPER
jgi:hypothetical protein